MALTFKEIELVNLGASIAAGCKPCTSYHFRKVKEATASDKEIKSAIEDAVNIRNFSSKEMENHALNHLGITKQNEANKEILNPDRVKVLVSIGASFAVNNAATLNNYIGLRKSVCITDADLNTIFKAVKLIKMKAALNVDKIAIRFDDPKSDLEINNSNDYGCSEKASDVQNKLENKVENGCC